MQRPFAKGPLAVRWLGLDVPEIRAGALTSAVVELENVGTAEWRSTDTAGILVAYHWLDDRGNPIVWDGDRSPLPAPVAPGGRRRAEFAVRGPIPPGRYTLGIDLVDEGRAWFGELGNEPLTEVCDVVDRIPRRLAARGGDAEALAAQEEPLVAEEDAAAVAYLADGVAPAPDWSRRVLDAHQEGYALVGGSVETESGLFRRAPRELGPYAPGPGRVPTFAHPLACPSVVKGIEPEWAPAVAGLPAARAPGYEPWIYDGRIRVRLRSGRPRA
jgi:hypothetical protein